MLVGTVTAVPWILSAISLIQDIEPVQKSFLPSLELFYQATGNKGLAAFLQAYLTMLYYCMSPAVYCWVKLIGSLYSQSMDHFESNRLGLFARCKW